ncbi:unnamed protein product [Alopecurus aequalis]
MCRLPVDDHMLREILLRLPPQPSSLPRASAVCKRWLAIVTDAKFQHQFRTHHREPPLLGAFVCIDEEIVFTPALDSPDHIHHQQFDLGRYSGSGPRALLDCRHGRVLIKDKVRQEIVVCDPIAGERHRVAIKLDFSFAFLNGAVLCAAGDFGHVHDASCHSSLFKVVLTSMRGEDRRHVTCVYSSETGTWGNLISSEASCVLPGEPAVLVGNRLYWLCIQDHIIEIEMDEASITVIGSPTPHGPFYLKRQIIQADGGAVGFAIFSYPRFETWQRKVNGHGDSTWVPWKTIKLDRIRGLPQVEEEMKGKVIVRGYEEDTDVMFLRVNGSVYMVQLKSSQAKKLYGNLNGHYHPFRSFYTPRDYASLVLI